MPDLRQRLRSGTRRDGLLALAVGLWVGLALGLDTAATLDQQRLLGVGTWLLLLALLRGETRDTRVQVGVVVAFATVVEYVFAGQLGVYVYRLDNIPAFVPPGHGLVYLAALAIGRSAWALRHARAFVATTLTLCGLWAGWGLLLAPRLDVLGAFWFGCLLVFTFRGRSPLLYAGAFVVVSYLELVGTSLGTWAWQPRDPTGWIAIGNPPSGIAGGYAWFDAAALALTPRILRRWAARRPAVSTDRAGSPAAAGLSVAPARTAAPPVALLPGAAARGAALPDGAPGDALLGAVPLGELLPGAALPGAGPDRPEQLAG